MSSFPRRIQRKQARRDGVYTSMPQLYEVEEDGNGYKVCHYTRGWKRFSALRMAAQHKMGMLLNPGPRIKRSKRK